MANPKKGTSQARNEFIWGWAFILPTMLGLIILNIYPIFKTIYESFFKRKKQQKLLKHRKQHRQKQLNKKIRTVSSLLMGID